MKPEDVTKRAVDRFFDSPIDRRRLVERRFGVGVGVAAFGALRRAARDGAQDTLDHTSLESDITFEDGTGSEG